MHHLATTTHSSTLRARASLLSACATPLGSNDHSPARSVASAARASRHAWVSRALAWTLCAGSLAGGCNWTSFDDYDESAPIRVHARAGKYDRPDYGKVLATYQAEIGGKSVSRIVASSGTKSPIAIARAWDGAGVSEKAPLVYCGVEAECAKARDYGATLIPFEVWGPDSPGERRGCVFSPANGVLPTNQDDPRPGGEAYVVCETHKPPQDFPLGPALTEARGGDGASLVFSGFGLPPEHPLGVVLYGAYASDNKTREVRSGGLYAQPQLDTEKQEAPFSTPVLLVDPTTQKPFAEEAEVGDFGAQVVGTLNQAGELLVAISQPSRERVIVASYDDALTGEPHEKLRVRACVAATERAPGFGERLLLADVTGDQEPELFVGNDPASGAAPGKQTLQMFAGEGLPGPVEGEDCPTWGSPPIEIVCSDTDGVSCTGSAFGSSIAVGDVDGDGHGDLIVGAPFAKVAGAEQAGAVWILPGADDGLDTERATALTGPTSAKARFGWSVAALRTKGRDEPVIAAPGVNDVFVQMCTPLEKGFGGDGLCLTP
jgi:hypothetical protein